MTVNYFCVCHRNGRKYSQVSELLCFKKNLPFATPDYISTSGKLNFLPINPIHLAFSSLEIQ